MENQDILLNEVVETVCILAASLSRDEQEYEQWALPFINLIMESQFGEKKRLRNYSFCVGSGFSLGLREEEDFVVIESCPDILRTKKTIAHGSLKEGIDLYICNFLRFLIENKGVYDARVRSLCRRFCVLFRIHAAQFHELENSVIDEILPIPNPSLSDPSEKNAVLPSFRMARIGAAAAAGGALVRSNILKPFILVNNAFFSI